MESHTKMVLASPRAFSVGTTRNKNTINFASDSFGHQASSHVDMIFAGIHWFKLLGNLNNWNIAHNLVEDMDKE